MAPHRLLDGLRASQLKPYVQILVVEAAARQGQLHHLARAGALLAGDERLGCQLAEADGLARAPRMVARHHDHQLVVPERLHGEVRLVGHGPFDEGDVQPLVHDLAREYLGVGYLHVDVGILLVCVVLAQEEGQEVLADGERGPDADAVVAGGRLEHGLARLADELHDLLRVAVEHLAALGEGDAPVGAVEELRAVFFLQVLDVDAHAWLAHVQSLGSAGDVAGVGNVLEYEKLL